MCNEVRIKEIYWNPPLLVARKKYTWIFFVNITATEKSQVQTSSTQAQQVFFL